MSISHHLAVLEVLHTTYLKSLKTLDKIPSKVIVPYNKKQFNPLQLLVLKTVFLTNQSAEFENHYPSSKLVKYF